MTARGDSDMIMVLVVYERLTDHGLALPLFATSPTANAIHVAIPSAPGDPAAHIRAFELYSTTEAQTLDASQLRSAAPGDLWIDVFIWRDTVHVGTRAQLWESTEPYHGEMEYVSPLSLLALAEGIDRSQAARSAAVAYEWLKRNWGSSRADRWRVDSYLTRLARRDLFRRLSMASKTVEVLGAVHLSQRQAILELSLPHIPDFRLDDLPELTFATEALGWRLEIVLEDIGQSTTPTGDVASARSLVMRLRHGRGRTQTQIPLRVVDSFFAGSRTLQDARTRRLRSMTLSKKAGEARNTMKLQLPEIAEMADPVARFDRRDDGIMFVVHDASSTEGREIAELLDEGVRDGSTQKTQRGATWWRVLPHAD